jgi:hypothetical protein
MINLEIGSNSILVHTCSRLACRWDTTDASFSNQLPMTPTTHARCKATSKHHRSEHTRTEQRSGCSQQKTKIPRTARRTRERQLDGTVRSAQHILQSTSHIPSIVLLQPPPPFSEQGHDAESAAGTRSYISSALQPRCFATDRSRLVAAGDNDAVVDGVSDSESDSCAAAPGGGERKAMPSPRCVFLAASRLRRSSLRIRCRCGAADGAWCGGQQLLACVHVCCLVRGRPLLAVMVFHVAHAGTTRARRDQTDDCGGRAGAGGCRPRGGPPRTEDGSLTCGDRHRGC